MVILKRWFPHCPQGRPVCCLSLPCELCPPHTHLSPAPVLLSHWTLFLLPTTLWPVSCCWRVRCLSFLRRLRCSVSVLWLSGPGKTIEKGPQEQQEAEDGIPLARVVRRDQGCQPGPEEGSRFHKQETVRDLTHALSLGGDCPLPPHQWVEIGFEERRVKKSLRYYNSLWASKAQSYPIKILSLNI